MALIIENGSGVAQANSYISESFVTTYLTDRARVSENDWSTATTANRQAAIVSATDYIETEFGGRFKGLKEFLNLTFAKGTLTVTTNPTDTTTVVIGSVTYTFNTTLGATNSILIGANTSASLDNLLAAINLNAGIGTTYGTGTVIHPDVSAVIFEDDALIISAKVKGTVGNLIITTTTVTGGVWGSTTLIGGTDTGRPQPLSFPRSNLLDRDGILVVGIPLKLKQASAEYTVRQLSTALRIDPTDEGNIIRKKEKVGPIEEETEYSESAPASDLIKSYPAADRLLSEFIISSRTLIRA